jgi:hypothetical protein
VKARFYLMALGVSKITLFARCDAGALSGPSLATLSLVALLLMIICLELAEFLANDDVCPV